MLLFCPLDAPLLVVKPLQQLPAVKISPLILILRLSYQHVILIYWQCRETDLTLIYNWTDLSVCLSVRLCVCLSLSLTELTSVWLSGWCFCAAVLWSDSLSVLSVCLSSLSCPLDVCLSLFYIPPTAASESAVTIMQTLLSFVPVGFLYKNK